MKEVIPVIITHGPDAFYSPVTDKIYYNKDLDDFPTLKEFVINHEQGHAANRNNYFYHVYRDLVDYPRQAFRRDWHEYQDAMQERRDYLDTSKVLWWQWLGYGFYLVANVFIQIIILPATITGMIWWMFFAKKKGGSK